MGGVHVHTLHACGVRRKVYHITRAGHYAWDGSRPAGERHGENRERNLA